MRRVWESFPLSEDLESYKYFNWDYLGVGSLPWPDPCQLHCDTKLDNGMDIYSFLDPFSLS